MPQDSECCRGSAAIEKQRGEIKMVNNHMVYMCFGIICVPGGSSNPGYLLAFLYSEAETWHAKNSG